MRIIPGKTKVGIELFRGATLADILVGGIGLGLATMIVMAGVPFRFFIVLAVAFVTILLIIRFEDGPLYMDVLHIADHLGHSHAFSRPTTDEVLLEMSDHGEFETVIGELFPNQQKEANTPYLSKAERKQQARKARLAAQQEKKREDKLLRSHTLTKEEEDAIWLKRANRRQQKNASRKAASNSRLWAGCRPIDEIVGFTAIRDDLIKYRHGYYGAVLEIPAVEFRFMSEYRRSNAIENALGAALRSSNPEYCVNLIKLEKPVYYDHYLELEQQKLNALRRGYENGVLSEQEFKSRTEIIFDRMNEMEGLNDNGRVVIPAYYLAFFDSDSSMLNNHVADAMRLLQGGDMNPHRLNDEELAVFLKYSNGMGFDERQLKKISPEHYADWAKPQSVKVTRAGVEINGIVTHNFKVSAYPMEVNDAWLATVMSMPATKVVMKMQVMDSTKAVRSIDNSLTELRAKLLSTGVDSKVIELRRHIESLEAVLETLQGENEVLLTTNVYVTAYDATATDNANGKHPAANLPLARYANLRKAVRRAYRENGLRLNRMHFCQTEAFVGAQPSGYDPYGKEGRGMPSNTAAAAFPWVFAHIADEKGVKYGSSDGVPVFVDFFRRDSERVNSNMVIVGKSGSGKSYATKSFLANLAADDSKIFILDPENEYTELAQNLHGKFINVGNAQYGRLNPFHIITSLEDDTETDTEAVSGSYATHLQFLEEFFKQILPDCDKDAMEYLNSLVDRMYLEKGITAETNLGSLRPEDYPIFDDLYDAILREFQRTDNNYIRTMLRTLMNYVSKFAGGGRNANIWNGPSTVTTEENFTVFNFQSLLANRNGMVANAQMLLVLKYIDNEIIKNREYNLKNNCNRKVVVVIDEAHVFIDSKFPVALDFMYQLAKRIRKYNGMQIVITQNIKDFVGSEELARKSTAIINACQYSFIFSLAPNDMQDLCKLYEKAGGINEVEQEEIITAPRGRAFTVLSPQSRSTMQIEVPEDTVDLFQNADYRSHYFSGLEGEVAWEEFLGDSRARHDEMKARQDAESKARYRQLLDDDAGDWNIGKANQTVNFEVIEDTPSEAPAPAPKAETVTFETVTEHEAVPEIWARPETAQPAAQPAAAPTAETASPQMESLMRQMAQTMESMKALSYSAIMAEVAQMIAQQQTANAAAGAAAPAAAAADVDSILREVHGQQPAREMPAAQPGPQPVQPAAEPEKGPGPQPDAQPETAPEAARPAEMPASEPQPEKAAAAADEKPAEAKPEEQPAADDPVQKAREAQQAILERMRRRMEMQKASREKKTCLERMEEDGTLTCEITLADLDLLLARDAM